MTDNEVILLNKIYELAKENKASIQKMSSLLIGDVEKSESPGLVERVRTVEKWIERREWYEKVIIVAISVEAIGLGFLIFESLIGF